MTAYQYAVLQYVPDPVRQESVNVGVVVTAPGSNTAEVRVLKTRDTAKLWLGNDDVGFLHDVAHDLTHPSLSNGVTVADVIAAAHQEWGGTIRVTELRVALHDDPRDLCEELYGRYVAIPNHEHRSPGFRLRAGGVAVSEMDTNKVTRFEVRDYTASRNPPGQPPGWSRVRYGVHVELALQDDGRTLKVFLRDLPPDLTGRRS